jgi:hypothetical protein
MGSHHIDFGVYLSDRPTGIPPRLKKILIVMMIAGLGLVAAGFAADRTHAFAAFVVNFMYWGGICQGAFMLAVALTITTGRWARPLKRLAEGFGLFMIPLYVCLVAFLLGGGLDIYEWSHWSDYDRHSYAHKGIYLTKDFFTLRMVVLLGILNLLNLAYIRLSLRADCGMAVKRMGDKAPALWHKLAGGCSSESEVADIYEKQSRIAPVIAISYSLIFSVVAVDMSMSLSPHWFANMFPAWYFMSCFWSGLVFLGIFSLTLRDWMGFGKLLDGKVYHDLGKLTFALCMFWGYTTFAQWLAIWYGNMTEEIGFLLLRAEIEPWKGVTRLVWVLCFGMPFAILLSRGLKKVPAAYLTVTGVIALGLFLERYLVVMPSVWGNHNPGMPEEYRAGVVGTGDQAMAMTELPTPLPELGFALFFLAALTMWVMTFLTKVPPLSFTDPFMQHDPDHMHVYTKSQSAQH